MARGRLRIANSNSISRKLNPSVLTIAGAVVDGLNATFPWVTAPMRRELAALQRDASSVRHSRGGPSRPRERGQLRSVQRRRRRRPEPLPTLHDAPGRGVRRPRIPL
jgi:hypothetical protein